MKNLSPPPTDDNFAFYTPIRERSTVRIR